MNTIDEVLNKMDEIVQECRAGNSRMGYFAVLYRNVTRRIKAGIENNEFEDNARMELLDVLFAKRFFEAYDIYKSNLIPSQSWMHAFRAAEGNHLLILHHLLLGINAHINLDLGIAAAQTMKNKPLAAIKNDFDKINDILAELVDGVKSNILRVSKIFGVFIRLANKKDEMLVNFSINIARKGAWEFAQRYASGSDRKHLEHLRDANVAKIAAKLAYPGKRMSLLISIIRLGEYLPVQKVMDELDKMEINPLLPEND
jgi:hypothetical protein